MGKNIPIHLVTRTGTTEGPFVKYPYLRKFPQLTEAVK